LGQHCSFDSVQIAAVQITVTGRNKETSICPTPEAHSNILTISCRKNPVDDNWTKGTLDTISCAGQAVLNGRALRERLRVNAESRINTYIAIIVGCPLGKMGPI